MESTTEFIKRYSIGQRAVGLLKELAERTTEACRNGIKFLTYDIMDSNATDELPAEDWCQDDAVATASLTEEERLMATTEMPVFEELDELPVALKRAGYPNLDVRCFCDRDRIVLMGKVFKFYHLQTAIESARKFADGRRIDVQVKVVTAAEEHVNQNGVEFESPVSTGIHSARN